MSKRGSLFTRTMVDFKSTPLEPLAFKARVVQFVVESIEHMARSPDDEDSPTVQMHLKAVPGRSRRVTRS
jgi:hypothetical protein